MKTIFLSICFLVLTFNLNAACPTGDITLSTQADVDSFPIKYPGCTNMIYSLNIDGNTIVNLNGLNSLNSIKNLYIARTSLTNMAGLNALSAITSSLFIGFNNSLIDLTGLNALASIGGALNIQHNASLTSLSGLGPFSSIGGLGINNNAVLTSIASLSSLTYIGNCNLSVNPALTNFTGLAGVTIFGGYLDFSDNASLTDITALSSVTSIGGFLNIRNNEALTSLSALSAVASINGFLHISNNDALTSLNGLDNINHISISNLIIQSSNILSYCSVKSICNYLAIPGNPATISGNTTGCNTRTEVLALCCPMTISATAAPNTICKNQSSTLTANDMGGTNPVTYLWNPGGLSGKTVTVTPLSTTTYTVTATDANNCSKSANVTVIVNPLPNAQITGNGNICIGGNTTLTASGGGTYLWNTGDVTNSITVSPSSTSTFNVTVTSSAGCTATASKTVIVNPYPNAQISGPDSICLGQSATLTASGGNTYLWNTGASTVFISVSPSSTTTFTVTVTSSGCSSNTTKSIKVNPIPNVNKPTDQIVCNKQNTNEVVFSGGVPGTSFDWMNNNTTIGLAASGNGNIAPFAAINNGTMPVVATITVTPTANLCTGPSQTFTITVNPTPNVNKPSDQILCNGSTTSTIVFTGGVSGTTYAWSNSNTTIGLGASGNGNINSFVATNIGTVPVIATITVTPTANSCVGPSQTFTITVNPTPNVNKPSDQIVCNGSNTNAVIFTSSVSGTTYAWSNSNTTIGLGASGNGNINSFVATNIGTVPVIATITVTPTANSCVGPSQTFTITVNPTPNVNKPSDQIVCNGSNTNAVIFTSSVSGTTFAWTNSNITIGLGGNGGGNINSFVAINLGTVPIIATITITPTANSCVGPSQTFTITINPTPNVNKPADQIVCNGSNTNAVIFSGGVSGTTYAWTNSNSSIGLSGNGGGNINSFVAINLGNVPIISTITVIPTANSCPGPLQTFTITVNPTPDVFIFGDQIICSGQKTIPVIFSGGVSGTKFTWINSDKTIGLGGNGIGNILSFTAINNKKIPVIAFVTVTPTANSCIGPSETFTYTINPSPNANAGRDSSICSGDSIKLQASGGNKYNWNKSNYLSDTTIQEPLAYPDITTGFIVLVANEFMCVARDTVEIKVSPKPVANFTNSVTGYQSIFLNNSSGASSFSWDFGDNKGTSIVPSPSYTYGLEGEFNVKLIAKNGCGVSNYEQIVAIYLIPKVNFSADVIRGCAPLRVNFLNKSSVDVNDWNWQFDGGIPLISTSVNPKVVFYKQGKYTVKLTVKNNNGSNSTTKIKYIEVISPVLCPERPNKKGKKIHFIDGFDGKEFDKK